MKKHALILILISISYFGYAQKQKPGTIHVIKGKSIYFTYEDGKLKYFTKGDYSDREPLNQNHTFELTGNFSNIYFGWLNPLKYQINWKDSTVIDARA